MRLAKRLPEFELTKASWKQIKIKVVLYVDADFEDKLFKILRKDKKIKKKYKMIGEKLVSSYPIGKELYGHEMNSEKSRDVYAMKIKIKGNHRIYCKEINYLLDKKIVLVAYRNKKTQGLNKELRDLVDRIGEYEYEFQE